MAEAAGLVWLGALGAALGGGAEWGGIVPEDGRTQNLRFQAGAVLQFEGVVNETTRKLYDVTGQTWAQADAESYNTDDFDLDGPFWGAGLSLDMAWKWVRLELSTMFLAPSVSTTAKRDYYLSVGDDISYGGQTYDHLLIREGTDFSADLFGNMTELTMHIVPLGFRLGEGMVINPSLGLGVVLFGGQYDIDAGEPSGVVQYQNPPEDFVAGGQASGWVGMGAPQWGPGVEVRMGRPGGLIFDLEAHYLFFQYDGSTSFFTTADHRDKDLDFDHRNLRLRAQVEMPMRRGAWSLGVQASFIDTEGTVESKYTDPEDILANRERFDKEFTFRIQSVLGTIGFAF